MQSNALQDGTEVPVSTVTSGINEGRFIEHLRELFSTSRVVLSELMQNARRAGASKVIFDFAEGNLVVSDDGCGIDDFAKLITIAESGWSEDVMKAEQPFGVGFSSVSFSAECILVESKGKSITFSSEDLVLKRPIAVTASDFIGGTRITLKGFRIAEKETLESLRNFAMGFAIPVIACGEELPRPHAQANLKGDITSIGFVHVPMVHGDGMAYSCKAFLYCQGLPVNVGSLTDNRSHGANSSIIHVDQLSFKPRVPDRDTLIDADKAEVVFDDAIKLVWQIHLNEEKTRLDSFDYVERYWDAASRLGCRDIFNDVPVLPPQVLSFQADYPMVYDNSETTHGKFKNRVTLYDVKAKSVILCRTPDELLEGDGFARMMFAQAKGFVYVDLLPEGHWANEHIIDLFDAALQISGTVLATGQFEGNWVSGEIKLVQDLAVTLNGETVRLTEPVALGTENWNVTFMVPKEVESPSQVLRQASSYLDEHEDFQNLAYDKDWDNFSNLVAILKGEPPEETVRKCLNEAGAKQKTNLRGHRFTVTFDEKGEFIIERA